MTQVFHGQLEIDNDRGVIYFHDEKTGTTKLRICNLPTPIPNDEQLDVTHLHGANWQGNIRITKTVKAEE